MGGGGDSSGVVVCSLYPFIPPVRDSVDYYCSFSQTTNNGGDKRPLMGYYLSFLSTLGVCQKRCFILAAPKKLSTPPNQSTTVDLCSLFVSINWMKRSPVVGVAGPLSLVASSIPLPPSHPNRES